MYLRISQDRTGEQAGVNRQREDCLALADELGWQVEEIYSDNDTSASGVKPREHYQRMLADVRSGRLEAVVAWHPDRLYRRMRDLEDLAEICVEHKLAVRTVRAGEVDLSTPTGHLVAQILGSIAQYEVAQKADRWQRSVRQRRREGRWWNSALRMFGYTRDGEIIPKEAAILRKVADDILSGETVHAVCRWLQAEGVTTTRGNDWQPTSLRATLRSPKIAGLSALDGQILGKGQWEPILDRDTWEQVCAAIHVRSPKGANPRQALLSGLIYCGVEDCGRRLYRGMRTEGAIYRCQTESKASGHVAISAAPVEKMVEAYARARLADPRVHEALQRRLEPGIPSELQRHAAELDDQLTELRASLTATKRDDTKADIVAAMDKIRDEIDAIQLRIDATTWGPIPVTGDEWPTDLPRRRRLIALTTDRIYVLPTANRGGRFDPGRVRIDPA